MLEENYNYTYTVSHVNIEQGTFEVMFTPESEYLTPVSLNTFLLPVSYMDIRTANNELIYATQDEVPFSVHLENTVKSITPFQQWKRQFILQQNIEDLQGKQDTVTIDANNIVIPVFNFDPPNVS